MPEKEDSFQLRSGLVKSEWMILIGLMMVVFSVLLPSVVFYKSKSLENETRQNIILLLSAGEAYYNDYGHWPTEYNGVFGDYRYGNTLSNNQVMHILLAVDGPGNMDHVSNVKQKTYIQLPPFKKGTGGLNEKNEFLDPWGTEYQIVLDTDLNNTTTINRSTYNPQIGLGMLVWSYGPDREAGSADDILSWRIR